MEKITENKENATRACLQLNDKIYPVHEGHNTVGRSPDAVINIKNLNVSKNHAVITVLDQDAHYLSDFKSSNGTFLNSKKLSPLQLYELNNGASVKFGDVVCTYKKLDGGTLLRKSLVESQACSESFYGASTQAVRVSNLPEGINFNELPTQMFTARDLSINEMPTQIFALNSLSINEMPTQRHSFKDLDESSDDSLDLMTMQKASETQMFAERVPPTVKNDTPAKSDTDPVESKVQPISNISLDSDTEDDLPDCGSVIGPVAIAVDPVQPKEQPTSNSKSLLDSNTDDDLPESGSVIRPVAGNSKRIEDSPDSETDDDLPPSAEIKPVQVSINNGIDSDSDTEEFDFDDANKTKYHISDDSETDIEDKDKEKTENLDESGVVQNCEEDMEIGLEAAAERTDDQIEESVGPQRLSKKVLPQDHVYCQAFSQTQEALERNEEKLSLQKKEEENDETTKAEDSAQTNVEDCKEEEEKTSGSLVGTSGTSKKDVVSSEKDSQETCSLPMLQTDEEGNDMFEQQTQVFNFNFVSDGKSQPNEEIPRSPKELNEEKASGDEEAPETDVQDEKMSAEQKPSNSSEKEVLHSAEILHKADELYLQPTQTLDFNKETRENPYSEDFFKDDDDEIFMQPTQILENSIKVSKPLQSEEANDEIFLRPTQAMVNLHGESPTATLQPIEEETDTQDLQLLLADEDTNEIPEETIKEAPEVKDQKALEEDIKEATKCTHEEDLLPPTQAMELLHGEDQIDEMGKSVPDPSDNDDICMPPTQALESLLSEDLDSTPKGDVFLLPNPSPLRKSTRRKALFEKSPAKDDDDDSFILQPTQALEELHDDGTPFNKVEDQLHEIFASQSMLCTQQLVDVLNTSKDDDVIEDSMMLERSMGKATATLTVKDILEDGDDEEASLVVNRSTKKKTYSKKNEDNEASTSKEKGKYKESDSDAKGVSTRGGRRKQDFEGTSGRKEENTSGDNKGETETTEGVKGDAEEKKEVADVESTIEDSKGKKKGRGKGSGAKAEVVNSDESKTSKGTENGTKRKTRRQLKTDDEEAQGSNAENDKDSQNSNKSERSTRQVKRKQNVEEPSGRVGSGDKTVVPLNSDKSKTGKETENETKRKTRRQLKKDDEEERGSNGESDEDTKGKRKGKGKHLVVSGDKGVNSDESRSLKVTESGTKRTTRSKLKAVDEDPQESNVASDTDSESSNSEKSTKRVKRKQNLDGRELRAGKKETPRKSSRGKPAEQSDGSQEIRTRSQDSKSEVNVSSSKGKDEQNVANATPMRTRRTRTTPEVHVEESIKRPKRKEATDAPPETPAKKRVTGPGKGTPVKRNLKLPSDSEDEFEPKVPKVEMSPPKLRNARKASSHASTSTEHLAVASTSAASSAELARRTRKLSANSRRQRKEEEEEEKTPVATPERTKRTLKPKVVFTMMDNPELESLIRQLGGSVVDGVDSCTVLVTTSVKRSQKLLCAVAQGKPVCGPQWLQACKKAFAFVDPWQHLLLDKAAEKKWNFSLRESISRASSAKLLHDHTFQIIVPKGNDTEKVLKGAIEACGGKCVTKNLAKCDSEHLIVVANENQKASYSRVAKQNPKIKTVQAEAIFDGTLRQEFKFDEFSLN